MADQTEDVLPKPSSRGKYREAWVGLFVIVGVTAGLTTLFTLTNASMFRGRYVLVTNVTDASGIRRGDPVQLRGVNIGRIQGFKIGAGGVSVRLEIEGEYGVPIGSKVALRQNTLLGGVVADVIPGTSTEFVRGGQALPGEQAPGLFSGVADLKDQATSVLTQAKAALSPETIQGIQGSTTELHQLLKELRSLTAEQQGELRELTRALRESAKSIQGLSTKPELERAITRLDSLTARLDETSASFSRSSASLETVAGRMERGEGTLGKLSKDEALYNNLNETVANLNRLAEDIRKQPKKYLKLSLF
jgi:phospholipid/cholesterol/gamma-HCH transport system substrate-binding protein